jgi:hypothetical protein
MYLLLNVHIIPLYCSSGKEVVVAAWVKKTLVRTLGASPWQLVTIGEMKVDIKRRGIEETIANFKQTKVRESYRFRH